MMPKKVLPTNLIISAIRSITLMGLINNLINNGGQEYTLNTKYFDIQLMKS